MDTNARHLDTAQRLVEPRRSCIRVCHCELVAKCDEEEMLFETPYSTASLSFLLELGGAVGCGVGSLVGCIDCERNTYTVAHTRKQIMKHTQSKGNAARPHSILVTADEIHNHRRLCSLRTTATPALCTGAGSRTRPTTTRRITP